MPSAHFWAITADSIRAARTTLRKPSNCTAWCEVIYGSGQERRDAGLEGADQPATFRTLASTETLAVTVADRINFDGFYWDITNVSPLDRDGVEWTAIRRASA